jgi:branched-chain amino acid transport system ATP-binding protein
LLNFIGGSPKAESQSKEFYLEQRETDMELLAVSNLSRYFGGLAALKDVNFSIEQGRRTAIIGPNGAGKSTLFNVISGYLNASKGEVLFQGGKITGSPPHEINRQGIARTFQITSLFRNISVWDNIFIGGLAQSKVGPFNSFFETQAFKAGKEALHHRAKDLVHFLGLRGREEMMAGNLAPLDQKKLSIAIALMSKPQLLLLDEPASGVIQTEMNALIDLFMKIVQSGITICLIEHKMGIVMKFAEHIVVLASGAKIAEGTPGEISNNEKVIKAYLGEKHAFKGK